MSGENQEAFISWGAGVNSTAIIALYLLEMLQGKPEVVFGDTGGELPDTYRYINQARAVLQKKGWKVTILRPFGDYEALYTKRVRGKTLYEYLWEEKTVPGIRWRFCTSDYKRDPIRRYAGCRPKMIGICADELKRMREDAIYPVRDYTRRDCKDLIIQAGLPMAHKTGCWFCPFQSKGQWIGLHDNHHDLWEKAVDLESNSAKWRFFSNGRTLQEQMDKWLRERDLARAQMELFNAKSD